MSFNIDRIQNSTRKVRKFLQKNSKAPGSRAVHDVRTNSRRLANMFLALGLASKGKVKRVLSNLEEIIKTTGKVRDLDVLTAEAMAVRHSGEKECRVQLLEYLGAQRYRYARKLRRTIQKTDPDLRRRLKQSSRRAEKIVKMAVDDPAGSNAISSAMAKSIKLSSDLQRPARLSRSNLHPYRVRVKELLNVLKLSERPADPKFLDRLGEVKDAIGEWHDWEKLVTVARDLSDHAASCKLIKGLKGSSDSKYERALSLTNHLRSDYLAGSGKRKRLRSGKSTVSEPVLKEVAAIAQ